MKFMFILMFVVMFMNTVSFASDTYGENPEPECPYLRESDDRNAGKNSESIVKIKEERPKTSNAVGQ